MRHIVSANLAASVTLTLLASLGCTNRERADDGGSPSAASPVVASPAAERSMVAAGAPEAVSGIADLAWLGGCWSSLDDTQRLWTEECWSTPAGDIMLGTNRTLRNGRVAAFEQLRIAAQGEYVWYFASPGGREPVAFLRVAPTESDRGRATNVAVFENLEHDFPQRIIYRTEDGRTLEATIEGVSGEETLGDGMTRPRHVRQSWRWSRSRRRSSSSTRCYVPARRR